MSKPLKAFGLASAASSFLVVGVLSVALIGAGIVLNQPSTSVASDINYDAFPAYEAKVMSEEDLEAKYGALNTEALHESKEFIIRRLAQRMRARRQAIQNFRRSYSPCSPCQASVPVPSPSAQPSRQPQPLLVVSAGSSSGGAAARTPSSCPGGVCPAPASPAAKPAASPPAAKPLEIVPDAVIQSSK